MRKSEGNHRDRDLIALFLSAYEDYSWRKANQHHPEAQVSGGVETVATRVDGVSIAFEHTLLEPFVGDRADVKKLESMFLPIENDERLRIPNSYASAYIPGLLLRPGLDWGQIVTDFHTFLLANVATFPSEWALRDCPTTGIPGTDKIVVQVRLEEIPDFKGPPILIRRYQEPDIPGVVDKALTTKLKKLVSTRADKKVLLLELNQWNVKKEDFNAEIERRRPDFPEMAEIDEIWFVDSSGYPRLTTFKCFHRDRPSEGYAFSDAARLIAKYEDEWPVWFPPPPDD